MKNQIRIAVIVCYFGKWPWYFNYFIHSCKFNFTIDFFIITDNKYEGHLSANVKILNMTLIEIKSLATQKLGFEVSLDYAYKLCDFKPAYGIIFSHILAGYDFWAQTDIDVIYGDIRAFMNDDMLINYDFISVRHDYTTGCFSMYRNNYLMNTLFKNSLDYMEVFSSTEHFCFDECNHVHPQLEDGSKSIFEISTQIESFTHVIKTAQLNGQIRAHFDFLILEGLAGRMKFIKGKIIYRNIYEILLYHLIKMKKIYSPSVIPKNIPDVYSISSSRIYHI